MTSSLMFQELGSETKEFIDAVNVIVLKILRNKGIEINKDAAKIDIVNNDDSS